MRPVWQLVFLRELSELWVWGKALILLILFSLLLGVMSFLLATNSELDLIPPKEMVFLTLQAAMAVGLFIGLIIGTDTFSGERERATLESLLVTPASRREIVVGKFLAALSPWPAAFVVAIPYLAVLAQGDPVFFHAILWGAILGTLLAPAFTGFAMLVSLWSNSNKTSMSLSLVVYILCVLPTQFPGTAQAGTMGQLLKKVNPIESTYHFLEKILVNNRTLEELMSWLLTPVLFAALVLTVLFWLAAPSLRLQQGFADVIRTVWRRRGAQVMLFLFATGAVTAASAQETLDRYMPLRITVDKTSEQLKTGDAIQLETRVSYEGAGKASPATIVALNIINLEGEGDPVDPEDWSPERTQYLEPLEPGETATQSWTVRAILDGDYMVYMVAIPVPNGPGDTSWPVASSGVHLTVDPFTRMNPAGVLPYAIAIPIALTLGSVVLVWVRRRHTRLGAA